MRCRLHYAEKNLLPDPGWHGKEGVVLCRGRERGPRNVVVRTLEGDLVVVPQGNVRAQPGPVKAYGNPENAGVQRMRAGRWSGRPI